MTKTTPKNPDVNIDDTRNERDASHDPHGPGKNPAGPNELGRMPTAPVQDQDALHHEQAEAEERAGNGPQDRPDSPVKEESHDFD
jgi:hypothetical protein